MSTLESRLAALITALGTDWKNIWAKIGGGTLNTTATNLIAAINEVKVTADAAGGAISLDNLSDVAITTPATGHVVRYNGSSWVNVLGTTYFEVAGAVAAAASSYQPVSSSLTAVAGKTPTSYGLGFLELVNQAGLMGLIAASSATAQGIVELATDAETLTGTDTARATTPANIAAAFTDRIDTNTSLGSSNTKVPSQNAVKAYVDALLDAANAMVYKGVIDASSNPNYPAASAGHFYRISVAGKIGGGSGINVEVGDTILCLTDSTSSGNQATVGSNWNIIQTNIDGAIVGPASSTASNLASFSGTTGKIIQDSGLSLDTDGTLTANSDTKIPSQKAVKTYAQPLNAGLTSISGLSTTSYGRALLELANQAALMVLLAAASESAAGIIEIATQTETNTGTDDARAVTPLKMATRITALIGNPDADLAAAYATAKA